MFVYLWLSHADIWQKSTQYFKAIIIQFKKIEKIVGEGIQVIISERRMLNKLTGKLNVLS